MRASTCYRGQRCWRAAWYCTRTAKCNALSAIPHAANWSVAPSMSAMDHEPCSLPCSHCQPAWLVCGFPCSMAVAHIHKSLELGSQFQQRIAPTDILCLVHRLAELVSNHARCHALAGWAGAGVVKRVVIQPLPAPHSNPFARGKAIRCASKGQRVVVRQRDAQALVHPTSRAPPAARAAWPLIVPRLVVLAPYLDREGGSGSSF